METAHNDRMKEKTQSRKTCQWKMLEAKHLPESKTKRCLEHEQLNHKTRLRTKHIQCSFHTKTPASYLRFSAGALSGGLIVLKTVCVIVAVVTHEPVECLHQFRAQVYPGPSSISLQFDSTVVWTQVVSDPRGWIHA